MKRLKNVLALGLVGALTVSLAGCDLAPSNSMSNLKSLPVLAQAFAATPTEARLQSLAVTEVELSCDGSTKKVVGRFTFQDLVDHEPFFVTGTTSCQSPGLMLYWTDSNQIYARDNYKVELVAGELDALMTQARLSPNPGTKQNDAVAMELEKKYSSTILSQRLRGVTFKCIRAGYGYEYLASYMKGRNVTGMLSTKCLTEHQHFEVDLVPSAEASDSRLLQVHQYNGARDDVMVAAFAEFIEGGVQTSQF